jgi:hypothetical protein
VNAAAYIPVFIRYEPGSTVRVDELLHSCIALCAEEHGEAPYMPFSELRAALAAAGYQTLKTGRGGSPNRVGLIRDAAWNDRALAAEAKARRITAENNRA